jgi:hypothetical protein
VTLNTWYFENERPVMACTHFVTWSQVEPKMLPTIATE